MAEYPPSKRRKIETLQSLVEQRKNDEIKSIVRQAESPLDLVDSSGMTLLHLAAKYNNTELIRFSLESGYNVNAKIRSSGTTPLLVAMENRSFGAVKILLNAGADVFAKNSADESVLGRLPEDVPFDVRESLFQSMRLSERYKEDAIIADKFLKAKCTLELVVRFHNARVTEKFLRGCTTIETEDSNSALDFAMKWMDMKNVRVLLHCEPGREERVSRFFFNLTISKSDLIFYEMYVELFNDWNMIDMDSFMGFVFVSFNIDCSDALQILLRHRIDELIKQKFGIDLLGSVFINSEVDAIELLKNRKFDVNSQGLCQLSPLHFALRSQKERYVHFLINLGANLEIRDVNGRTPLLYDHAWHGEFLGRILLQYGADLQAVDYEGKHVFDVMSTECFKNFAVPHAALLDAKGTINQEFRELVHSDSFVETYRESCRQIEGFKGCKLTDNVTLLDLMIGRTERIADEIRDENFINLVQGYCRGNQVLEYYSSTLEMKLERARVVYLSKKNMAMIVSGYIGSLVDFDHLVIEKIYELLNYQDLCALLL